MGGQLDGIFLAGSLPREFIILIVTLFICLWLINLSLSANCIDTFSLAVTVWRTCTAWQGDCWSSERNCATSTSYCRRWCGVSLSSTTPPSTSSSVGHSLNKSLFGYYTVGQKKRNQFSFVGWSLDECEPLCDCSNTFKSNRIISKIVVILFWKMWKGYQETSKRNLYTVRQKKEPIFFCVHLF